MSLKDIDKEGEKAVKWQAEILNNRQVTLEKNTGEIKILVSKKN